jgi:hypothetical protein
MNLFRKRQQVEPPAPPIEVRQDELTSAILEETAARTRVQETSAECARLDHEHRTWQQRRDSAYRAFNAALVTHAEAKAAIAHLSKEKAA